MTYYLGQAHYTCPYCGNESAIRHFVDDPKRSLMYCSSERGGCDLQYVMSITVETVVTAVAMPIPDQIEKWEQVKLDQEVTQ